MSQDRSGSRVVVGFDPKPRGISAKWVGEVVRRTLKRQRIQDYYLSVLLTNDRRIRQVNKQHLNHDYATDVISFGYRQTHVSGKGRLEGELVVSHETARRFAASLKITVREELARYLVHGTLHLIGFDDRTPAKRRRMFARQEALLKQVL